MKKSKIVAIGLLALSIASCSNHKKPRTLEEQQKQNYYVNDGSGYHHGGVNPFMMYYLMSMNRGQPSYGRTYVYHTNAGDYRSTTNGVRSSVSKSSYKSTASSSSSSSRSGVSRGGFGRSGGSHSSSSAS